MHDERTRGDGNRFFRRLHAAMPLEAKIDLGSVRVGMIGTNLAWLPTRHSHVSLPGMGEDFFHMAVRSELLFFQQVKNMHE
ncbi:hypothetical protein ACFLYV_04415 [Chloroflexota bacterium]